MSEAARLHLIWTKLSPTLLSRLSFNILREVCAYLLPTALLVALQPASIRFFTIAVLGWSAAVATKVQVNGKTSCWVLADRQRVFCCGGSGEGKRTEFWTCCCWIESNGTVLALPTMLQGRCNHGLIQWQRRIMYLEACTSTDIARKANTLI